MLLMSRWAYSSYPLGQFLVPFVVAINIFAAFSSIIYFNKFKVRGIVLLFICLIVFDIPAVALVKNADLGVFVIDLCLVIVNVFGILVVIVFQRKFALYTGLPQNFPDLPSFGPEDVPTGQVVEAEREDSEVVEEGQELADAGQLVQQEEQEEEEEDMETPGRLTRVTVETQVVPTDHVEEAGREETEVKDQVEETGQEETEVKDQVEEETEVKSEDQTADVSQPDQKRNSAEEMLEQLDQLDQLDHFFVNQTSVNPS